MVELHAQTIVVAPVDAKVHASMLATAMVDALGGPAEFKRRFSFPPVTSMIPNKNFADIGPGTWTDDTSMTLCLARSIAKGSFDEKDQMEAYVNWRRKGVLSAVGRCFDIGMTIARALRLYQEYEDKGKAFARIRNDLAGVDFSGNGSLMRVLPIGLAYWRDEEEAKMYARRSSVTTHPSPMCIEACAVWTGAISKIIRAANDGDMSLSKLDLMQYFATYPYEDATLREALTFGSAAPPLPENDTDLEKYYHAYHPILKLIAQTRSLLPTDKNPYFLPNEDTLPSSGYVLDSFVAALYCFFATESFEQGALTAVNLGSDADTVGAIYAGLAGCWYGCDESQSEAAVQFWTPSVRTWKNGLVRRDLVEEVASELAAFANKPRAE